MDTLNHQQQQEEEEEKFTVVSMDESFFFYDSLVRKVWISKNERPVVKITGSHQESVLFGATSLKGKQLFRQYYWFDQNTFLDSKTYTQKISKMLSISG